MQQKRVVRPIRQINNGWPLSGTKHDWDYIRVYQAVQEARADMGEHEIHRNIDCPLCGGDAFILPYEGNTGRACVALCTNGCFECWE